MVLFAFLGVIELLELYCKPHSPQHTSMRVGQRFINNIFPRSGILFIFVKFIEDWRRLWSTKLNVAEWNNALVIFLFFPALKRLLWNSLSDALKSRQAWHLAATFWKRKTSLLNIKELQTKSVKKFDYNHWDNYIGYIMTYSITGEKD